MMRANALAQTSEWPGERTFCCDAGRSTIDISAYPRTSPHSQSYEEIVAPQCQAKIFFEGLLGKSRFSGDIPHIVKRFDNTTKLRFRNPNKAQYIEFGGIRDNDPTLNIRSGQLKLLGSDVTSLFEPSVQCIVKSTKEQCEASETEFSSVFLVPVGGFAASDWLYQKLKVAFTSQGHDVSTKPSLTALYPSTSTICVVIVVGTWPRRKWPYTPCVNQESCLGSEAKL